MQHHCTCKSYTISTTSSYWEAPCPRSSIYQPSVNFYVKNMLYNTSNFCPGVWLLLTFVDLVLQFWVKLTAQGTAWQAFAGVVTGVCLFQYSNLYSQEFISTIVVIFFAQNCASGVEPCARACKRLHYWMNFVQSGARVTWKPVCFTE